MNNLGDDEAKENILTVVNSRGYRVSSDQLTRWHRKGLLPRPKQVHLGRRGSLTVYPSGTTEQVIEVCHRLREEPRLIHIAWQLWWNGFSVDIAVIRSFMKEVVKEWDQFRCKYTWLDRGIIREEIEASKDKRFRSKAIRQMRKRASRQKFPSVLKTILAVITGQYLKDSSKAEEDQMNLEKAVGMGKAREQNFGAISPWIKGEQLNEASSFFGKLNFSDILSNITDEELVQARKECRALIDSLRSAGQAIDRTFGESAFGLSPIGALLNDSSAIDQALFLLFWLALRKNKNTKKSIDVSIENQKSFAEIILQDRGLELMKTEIPSLAAILPPRKMRAAMRNTKAKAKHLAKLNKFYTENQKEIDEFLERHPEYRITEN